MHLIGGLRPHVGAFYSLRDNFHSTTIQAFELSQSDLLQNSKLFVDDDGHLPTSLLR